MSPRALRGTSGASDGLRCQLEFRPPFAWNALLSYLSARAVQGVESVDGTHYRRTVAIGDRQGWIAVSMHEKGGALNVEISASLTPVIGAVMARVKRLFDLGAVPDAVAALLGRDPLLTGTVRRIPACGWPAPSTASNWRRGQSSASRYR